MNVEQQHKVLLELEDSLMKPKEPVAAKVALFPKFRALPEKSVLVWHQAVWLYLPDSLAHLWDRWKQLDLCERL